MPAISPARLKREVETLFALIEDPLAFQRALRDLLETYADRTYRASQTGVPGSILPTLHVPKPVIRKVIDGLGEFAEGQPGKAMLLSDSLWDMPEIEYRLLAVRMLESIPVSRAADIVVLLRRRILENEDESLHAALFKVGVQFDREALIELVNILLDEGGSKLNTALAALSAISSAAGPNALPGIFRLFRAALVHPGADRNPHILALSRRLAAQAPVETAYFLRQQYLVSLRPEFGRLLRQCMESFPEDVQADLKRMLRENPVE